MKARLIKELIKESNKHSLRAITYANSVKSMLHAVELYNKGVRYKDIKDYGSIKKLPVRLRG